MAFMGEFQEFPGENYCWPKKNTRIRFTIVNKIPMIPQTFEENILLIGKMKMLLYKGIKVWVCYVWCRADTCIPTVKHGGGVTVLGRSG